MNAQPHKPMKAILIYGLPIILVAMLSTPASSVADKLPITIDATVNECSNGEVRVTEDGEICSPKPTPPNAVTCALGSVVQGVAEAYNSDCILTEGEQACMNFGYHFEYRDGSGTSASYMATFSYVRYLDIIPDLQPTLEDTTEPSIGIPAGGFLLGGPEKKTDADGGDICLDSVVGLYSTTAFAAGRFEQVTCNWQGDCIFHDKTPYNSMKAPGHIIGIG